MKLSLVVLTPGKGEGKVIPITLPQFLIGRDPQCHLRPASAMISKRHCALLLKDEQAFVRDFDSTNGTFLNDDPVKGEIELHHEDKLRVGPLIFSVQLAADAPAEKPAAARPAASSKTPAPPTRSPAPIAGKTPPPATRAPTTKTVPVPQKPAAEKPITEKPAAQKTPAGGGGGTDDDIAAMLLMLQDESEPGATPTGEGVIPEGSTVFDVPAMPGQQPEAGQGSKEGKMKDAKKNQENTSDAARAILEKYMRRPRGG